MAFEDRSYSGNAVPATLTANINNTATSIPISTATGWPDGTSGPFHVGIALPAAPDTYVEVVRCSGRTGLTLNVQTVPTSGRGWDGTVAQSHLTGAVIVPVFTATDADEANQHYSNVALDHHTQYLNVARHDLSARHGIGILPVGGTPSTSVVGDTSQAGTSGLLSRSDHKHAREGFGSPGAAGAVNADGTATTVPRSDHTHAGGIPILASAPSSPVTGQTYIDSATTRIMSWNGTAWSRGPHYSSTGRTGAFVSRFNTYSIPDGGASTHIIPIDTETFDSDGFMPTPDGTTTTTLTVPTGLNGFYLGFLQMQWGSATSVRSYIELIHHDGTSLFQYRTVTTNEDRGTVTAFIGLAGGHTIQIGAWQNSGAAILIGGWLYLFYVFR